MKFLLTIFSALILVMGVSHDADAKRFGGGGFGKSFSSPYKSSPASSPSKAPAKGGDQAKAAPARGGLMGGMLGGLLAGGLFAYLLGSGAFEGLQLMDILLIGGVIFLIMRLLRGSQTSQHQARAAYAGNQFEPNQHSFQGNTDMSGQANTNLDTEPLNLPEGFDAPGFINGALEHYHLVQKAWNDGNLDLIKEYVSPNLFAALASQRQKLMVPPQTEVLDLNAEIVRADEGRNTREISILFRGRCRDLLEKSEDGIFDIWHLERDTSVTDSPWIVVGIEAD
ncbi:MAG: Tim44-like domain-containing protein [Oleibacter sp.]|nr:Tim44-like domain-containing protein [Thalassolituus sp.]